MGKKIRWMVGRIVRILTGNETEREMLIRGHMDAHRSLDWLIARHIAVTGKTITETTVMTLLEWSHGQTKSPDKLT